MSAFLNQLATVEVDDQIFQIAYRPFRYQCDILGQVIVVPIGFKTDFASVPRIGIIYAMLGDTAHEPAVIHDWLYYSALTDRPTSDRILLEAMTVLGLSAWRRYPIYWGVRAGGWYAWDQHRKSGNPQEGKFQNSPNIAK